MKSSASPTIADVARQAGVSTATVSRVLNGSAAVTADTLERVQAAITALGYQMHPAAHALASRRTRTIGVLIDELGGESTLALLRGIERGALDAGYDVVICPTRHRDIPGRAPLAAANADGLIAFANSLTDGELARTQARGVPVVLLARTAPQGLQLPSVTVENEQGAHALVRYLLAERGYRRFGFLEGEADHEDSQARVRGWKAALAEWGLAYDQQRIGRGDFSEHTAHHIVRGWAADRALPQVIVAADDDSAIGAIAALHEVGVRVPEDVAVVGFDDIRLAGYTQPPLTTVRAPIGQAAERAVQMLVAWMETGSAAQPVVLPVQLVIRRSCGASAQEGQTR
jgi:DNA-binding LacI/PurR family transcriptional regulator